MQCFSRGLCAALLVAVFAHVVSTATLVSAEDQILFGRDIRPILSDKCFQCHGRDESSREAGLRLDVKESAMSELDSGETAIVPRDPDASALIQRITEEDPDMRMPPADSGKSLSPKEIELLNKWVEGGASWGKQWSLVKPERPELPQIEHPELAKNAIDYFTRARLASEGLEPAPEADKVTLIRRVTFDLTGFPPTPAEVDAFLADESPDAYERLVDRLLASPRYGEHMARYWLDAARFGDTHGLHFDNERSIWPYRDWVIAALNDNMPFDQFTIEQLAGDLLPNATLRQRVATGFNRCNVTTSEGGSIDDEYYVRYAVDRVETTSTVWMGLTMGCAVCHDHKFDPFSQKEFYQLFAYFNSLTEKAMDGNAILPPPFAKAPSPEQQVELTQLNKEIAAVTARLDGPMPEVDAGQLAWEREWSQKLSDQWQTLEPFEAASDGGATLTRLPDNSLLAEGKSPETDTYQIALRTGMSDITAIRLEVLTDERLPRGGPGRASNANFVLGEFEVEAVSIFDPSKVQKIKFVSAKADYSQSGYDIANSIDGNPGTGWAVDGRHENRTAIFLPAEPFGFENGTELRVRMPQQFGGRHNLGRFRLAVSSDGTMSPATFGDWHQIGPFTAADGNAAYQTDFGPESDLDLTRSYEQGKLEWTAKPELADGVINSLAGDNAANYLYRTIYSPSPRNMTLSLGSDDAIKVWLNGQVVLDKNVQRPARPDQERITINLQAGKNDLLLKVVNFSGQYQYYFKMIDEDTGAGPLTLAPLLATAAEKRSEAQIKQLREYYRRNHAPQWQELNQQITALRQEEGQLYGKMPSTMVMEEAPKPKDAYVLIRGAYDKPDRDQKAERKVPEALPPLPEGVPNNRLGLARWLVDPSHPLTARVIVNRYWQQYFGTGLVKTAEDFGSQGEYPSHPQLLDWLASEFIHSGWDIKHMQKQIVMSATYRQSSKITPEGYAKDVENRLLWRGPRFRMDAEMIRDTALAVSGLLVEKIGGRSVRPYQPSGLWKAVGFNGSNTENFRQDQGDALYRRSMYTFWKRTSPPPTMAIFGAPTRETCVVRRERANTPLGALVLMNDVQFVEAARHLAQRMMTEGGETPEDRILFAFRLATSRRPSEKDASVLIEQFRTQLTHFQSDREAALQLVSVGDSGRDESLDISELAAWTMVANLVLNMNETVTKR